MLFEQMIVLFLVMCAGYYCSKKGIITEEVNRGLSALVVNITNPALILTAGMGEEKIDRGELLFMGGLAVLISGFLILLAAFLPGLLGIDKKSRGAYRVMTVFGNTVFMGLPIITAVYGDSSVLYAAGFVIMANILIYTYGIMAMRMDLPQAQTHSPKEGRWMDTLKRILNVGVICCFITLFIYLSDWKVPSVIQTTASLLGNITAPVSMMVIGASLTGMDRKALFTDRKLVLFVLIRLLLVPAVGMVLVNRFVAQEMMRGVCMVMMATPVASMTTMLARQYGGDYELTARGIALSTVLSVVTMPIIQMLFL